MLRRALRNYCWNIGYFVKASSCVQQDLPDVIDIPLPLVVESTLKKS